MEVKWSTERNEEIQKQLKSFYEYDMKKVLELW